MDVSMPGRAAPSSPVPAVAAFSCRCCRASFATLAERKEHHRSDWHAYNLRRSVGNLVPVTKEEFTRKVQVALFASQLKQDKSGNKEAHIDAAVRLNRALLNASSPSPSSSLSSSASSFPSSSFPSSPSLLPSERERVQAVATLTALGMLAPRGEDHLKGKKVEKSGWSADVSSEAAHLASGVSSSGASGQSVSGASGVSSEAQRLEKARRLALATAPECVSLFDFHAPFASWRENLAYMRKTFSFAIPHAEYLADPPAFLRTVWKAQLRKPRCLWCQQRFASVAAAQQHMQTKGHTQLRWEEKGEASSLQRALEACFDFRASYLALLERAKKTERHGGGVLAAGKRDPRRALESGETPEAASGQEGDGESGAPERTERLSESDSDGERDSEDDWEDVSDEDFSTDEDEEDQDSAEETEKGRMQSSRRGEDKEDEVSRLREACKNLTDRDFRRIMRQCGEMQARLTETGDLRLPDGRELVNRHVAYIYKQRLGRRVPGDAEAQVLADSYGAQDVRQLLAGGRGSSVALACMRLSANPAQQKVQIAARLRQDKHRRLLATLGRSGRGLSEKQLRKTEREVKHKVLVPREQFAKRTQKHRMQLGVKQNTLQKFILQEHKFFC
uniref:C2H2-type domain-containing protein n=1 Tax=Neospora caninum (strain Liverpool) TaxID=572307 RepID=F0JAW4_NEOCL|nr:hypothetical protein NCLIV_068940 [Neospora caninum Liverpool]CEL71230.1 TPA: hypothetical protein BN1204_068940 [Neospora caninum Liverpool]